MCRAEGIGGIVWRQDGSELFYLAFPPTQGVMSVDLANLQTRQPPAPRRLFDLQFGVGAPAQLSAVSSPDGQRFLFAVNLPSRAKP